VAAGKESARPEAGRSGRFEITRKHERNCNFAEASTAFPPCFSEQLGALVFNLKIQIEEPQQRRSK